MGMAFFRQMHERKARQAQIATEAEERARVEAEARARAEQAQKEAEEREAAERAEAEAKAKRADAPSPAPPAPPAPLAPPAAPGEEGEPGKDAPPPPTGSDAGAERGKAPAPWTMKVSPEDYLQRHPEGPNAALAREHVEYAARAAAAEGIPRVRRLTEEGGS